MQLLLKMKRATEIFFLILVNFHYYSAKELPAFIKKCKQTDPELGKCLLQRTQDVLPRVVGGIPELKIPPIDPLFIPKLEVQFANTFQATYKDVEVYGLKDVQFKQFEIDFQTQEVLLHFSVPSVRTRGHYSFVGKILLFELNSTGMGYLNVTDADAKGRIKFTISIKNGKHYVSLTDDHSAEITLGTSSAYFENLIANNQELTQQINRAINEYVATSPKESTDPWYKAVGMLVDEVVQKVLQEFSLEDLFEQ